MLKIKIKSGKNYVDVTKKILVAEAAGDYWPLSNGTGILAPQYFLELHIRKHGNEQLGEIKRTAGEPGTTSIISLISF